MPWKTSGAMSEKLEPLFECGEGKRSVTELGRQYEIARATRAPSLAVPTPSRTSCREAGEQSYATWP
jgi:hypothetical protein